MNRHCSLIPAKGNTAEIVLTVLHHNFVGIDEFLGSVHIPLSDLDDNRTPRSK